MNPPVQIHTHGATDHAYVESAITFDAQNLETVNGAIFAGSATTFNASKLVRVDGELILPVVTMVAVMPNCPAVCDKVARQI